MRTRWRPRRQRRRTPALAAIAAGLGLMLAAVGMAWSARPPPNIGTHQAQRLAEASGPGAAASGPGAAAAPRTGDPAPPAAVVAPVALRVAAIRLTAPVEPTGVDEDTGLVLVPPEVTTLGWYRFSRGLDASAGSIVIVGHVDGADERRGAFFNLRRVAVGDEVIVTGADGRDRGFRVIAREQYPKAAVPLRRVFARDGAARLTLVTCGGGFDHRRRTYHDNVVVTAVAAQPVG